MIHLNLPAELRKTNKNRYGNRSPGPDFKAWIPSTQNRSAYRYTANFGLVGHGLVHDTVSGAHPASNIVRIAVVFLFYMELL